jgi:hypothetical protein
LQIPSPKVVTYASVKRSTRVSNSFGMSGSSCGSNAILSASSVWGGSEFTAFACHNTQTKPRVRRWTDAVIASHRTASLTLGCNASNRSKRWRREPVIRPVALRSRASVIDTEGRILKSSLSSWIMALNTHTRHTHTHHDTSHAAGCGGGNRPASIRT